MSQIVIKREMPEAAKLHNCREKHEDLVFAISSDQGKIIFDIDSLSQICSRKKSVLQVQIEGCFRMLNRSFWPKASSLTP